VNSYNLTMKTKATVLIDSCIWKRFKKKCISEDKTYSKKLEETIKKEFKNGVNGIT